MKALNGHNSRHGKPTLRGTNFATIPAMIQASFQPGLNVGDALDLLNLWRGLPAPQSIITSPPYLDMHNYGNSSQIGKRGQSIEEYLTQMHKLFSDCHYIATPDATFWLVAGAVRRNNRLIPLPDRLVLCAEKAGWTLRESITWDKQKALPWTHHGELRDITEQVLLFSKSDNFRFDPTDLRSPIPNSTWWRRYPERYSPMGAMPTNLWSIPIPTQGAWAGIRTHFCPFPEELTYRVISLTTVQGDTVLDPLAGIGSVPAMAQAMGRIGYGIELSEEYAAQYQGTRDAASMFLSGIPQNSGRRGEFHRTIVQLRILKFAKLLAQQINDAGLAIPWVRVSVSDQSPRVGHHVAAADFVIVLDKKHEQDLAAAIAYSAIRRPPLSKFGIDARVAATHTANADTTGYWYARGRFWNDPVSNRPTDGEPHVLADFRPDPDQIDDIPYG